MSTFNVPATALDLSSEQRTTFVVEEYKALREEILTAIRAQIDILRFGSAALALLLAAGGAATDNRPLLAGIIFVLFAPTVGATTLIMWSNEVFRMMRAAAFVFRLEDRLKSAVGTAVLRWEHEAHKPKDPDVERIHRWTIRIAFGVISIGSIVFGEYLLFGPADTDLWGSIALATVVVEVSAAAAVLKQMDREIKRLLNPYQKPAW